MTASPSTPRPAPERREEAPDTPERTEDMARYVEAGHLFSDEECRAVGAMLRRYSAALAPRPSPAAGWGVKPLEWQSKPAGTRPGFFADSPIGRYAVREASIGVSWYCGQDFRGYEGSVEAAKAKCDADFATRILSALAPSPGTREAARVLLAALERAQIDSAILKLFYNGQPSAALRALAAAREGREGE